MVLDQDLEGKALCWTVVSRERHINLHLILLVEIAALLSGWDVYLEDSVCLINGHHRRQGRFNSSCDEEALEREKRLATDSLRSCLQGHVQLVSHDTPDIVDCIEGSTLRNDLLVVTLAKTIRLPCK